MNSAHPRPAMAKSKAGRPASRWPPFSCSCACLAWPSTSEPAHLATIRQAKFSLQLPHSRWQLDNFAAAAAADRNSTREARQASIVHGARGRPLNSESIETCDQTIISRPTCLFGSKIRAQTSGNSGSQTKV